MPAQRPLLLRGGRVVDPASRTDRAPLDLLVVDGRVARTGVGLPAPPEGEVLDVAGLVVAPGFVDMHVHLREPGGEEAETIESGTRAAAAGGFTAVACMANTDPVNDSPEVTAFIRERAAATAHVRVWPIAAITRGLQGRELVDLGALKAAGAVGASDDGRPVVSSERMRRALERADAEGMLLIQHCEDAELSPGWSMHEGPEAVRLHRVGLSPASEEILLARDAILSRHTGARVHAAHLSTRGSIERLRAEKARGVRVSGEATPHHFALTEEAVAEQGANAKMNPPLREAADVEAVLAGLADGTIDCIATDHAPHGARRKAGPFEEAPNGVIGLETAVSVSLDRLLHRKVVSLGRLVELLSTNPARLLGVPGGSLVPGAVADLTLLDLDREVVVDPASFASRSRNTPFGGLKLKGAPAGTIVGGRLVWWRGREVAR